MTVDQPDRDPAPAVTRALAILDILADAGGRPMSLSDLARAIGAAKSSTLNVCSTLEAGRLIQRRDGGYALGRRTVELGGAYLSTFDQVREFYRLCAESPVLSHELVQIAILDGTDVLYLARHEGRAPLRFSAGIGDRFPAALTAVGNAILATLDPGEVAERFSRTDAFPRRTEKSTASLAQLQVKLERVRERGVAIDEGEVHPAVVGVAAAVPARQPSESTFAVGVSLVGVEVDEHLLDTMVVAVSAVAGELSRPLHPA
jgi:DNA-binding IclR family transcriptional regulator